MHGSHMHGSYMQGLMMLYAPIYRKSTTNNGWYVLHGFAKIAAKVHPNDPFAEVWSALDALKTYPAVLFEAGDKTTFLTLCDDCNARPKERYHMPQTTVTAGERTMQGDYKVQCESSLVFVDRGYLHTLPIPDYKMLFPARLCGAHLHTHVSQLTQLMQTTYQRLKHNVQFVDLQDKVVVGCQRLEGNVLCRKRKRNVAFESQLQSV